MNRLALIVAPTTPVLTLIEAKDHLRVTHSDEDLNILSLVDEATAQLDGWQGVLGMALEAQTWEWTLDGFPAGGLCIPLGPVVSVVSIKYTDTDGAEQTVPAADYETHQERIRPASGWPATDRSFGAVRVQFVAGKGTPANIKRAAKLLIGHWYDNPNAVGDKMEAVPMAYNMCINSIRRVRI